MILCKYSHELSPRSPEIDATTLPLALASRGSLCDRRAWPLQHLRNWRELTKRNRASMAIEGGCADGQENGGGRKHVGKCSEAYYLKRNSAMDDSIGGS